jgi:hypothetical protein
MYNMDNLKLIFSTILLASTVICSGQTYSSVIPDKEIIGFMNWKFNSIDTMRYAHVPKEYCKFLNKIWKWRPAHFEFDSSSFFREDKDRYYIYNDENRWLDTILNSQDRNFIIQQSKYDTTKTTKWLIKTPKNRRAKRGYDYYFTLPLFSVDKNYVLLKEIHCCRVEQITAESKIILYKKTDTGWTFYKYVLDGLEVH